MRRVFALVLATAMATAPAAAVTDDDLQVRGTYRFKVADSTYAPSVGVGGGWSQERTLFDACTLPLVQRNLTFRRDKRCCARKDQRDKLRHILAGAR